MNEISLRIVRLGVAGLIGAAGLAGCKSDPAGPEAMAQSTSRPAPTGSGYEDPGYDSFDPYAVALTADDPASFRATGQAPTTGSHLSLTPKTPSSLQRSDEVHSFYGEVFSGAGKDYDTLDPTKAGGASLSQISFSVEGADFDPDISPDGRFTVYASTQHSHTSDIFMKSVESRVVTQLTRDESHDVMPKFSPDGKRVAFASNRSGNWDIFVMSTSGGKAVQITTESSHELHPSWSPDGKQLVFCRLGEVSGKWELWVTDVQNTGVAHFLGYGLFPEWSPVVASDDRGASRILFQMSKQRGDRAFSIWSIDFANGKASNLTQVATSATAACINPAWSRDGQWISFATVPNPTQWSAMEHTRPASANLWMVSASGHGLVNLTEGAAVNLMPAWGAGNELFFVSDRGGVDNIWSMDVGSAIAAITGETLDTSVITTVTTDEQ
ncbi:MAG: DPP IV N-terminal domain-containing protein [Phycisphaerales bacterium JB039]